MARQELTSLQAQQVVGTAAQSASGSSDDTLQRINEVVKNIQSLMQQAREAGLIHGMPQQQEQPHPASAKPVGKPDDTMKKVTGLVIMYLDAQCRMGNADMPIGQLIAQQQIPTGQVLSMLRQAMPK